MTCGKGWRGGYGPVRGTVLGWCSLVQGVSKWRACSMLDVLGLEASF